ncbi:MAG: helix-turn-helix transcriptional regulator, partial [Maribacter sp.]
MIKKKVKALLSAKGITQIDLAAKLDITPETLSRTINGNPTLKSLKDIAHALDVEVVQLFPQSGIKGFIEYDGKVHTIDS